MAQNAHTQVAQHKPGWTGRHLRRAEGVRLVMVSWRPAGLAEIVPPGTLWVGPPFWYQTEVEPQKRE